MCLILSSAHMCALPALWRRFDWVNTQQRIRAVCCSVLQCVAVCCSVLQCAAVCCSVLQCVAVRCSVLQCVAVCVAVCCGVLQLSSEMIDASTTHTTL